VEEEDLFRMLGDNREEEDTADMLMVGSKSWEKKSSLHFYSTSVFKLKKYKKKCRARKSEKNTAKVEEIVCIPDVIFAEKWIPRQ
jgi:hypothetical protein